jgi:hypothetical protein
MKAGLLVVLSVLAFSGPTLADCLTDLRDLNAEESRAVNGMGNIDYFRPGSACAAGRVYSKFLIKKAGFYRRCYAELGLTALQAEEKAHGFELAAEQMAKCI